MAYLDLLSDFAWIFAISKKKRKEKKAFMYINLPLTNIL